MTSTNLDLKDRLTTSAWSAVLIGACAWLVANPVQAKTVVDGDGIADEKQGANWLSSGRTYAEHHYSPLGAIHTGSIKDLGLAWYLDLPGQRTLQATPLAVDGILYFSGTHGWVFAVEGRTGKLLWQFDPELSNEHLPRKPFGSNRGVAFWQGKVYVGTVDGRLVALDARMGTVIWSTQTLDEAGPRTTISGAPRVFNNKVIIGNGGYDGATRAYVSAYDAQSGRKVWRFYTVPGDPAKGFESKAMAMAAKTWEGKWWKQMSHSSVWDNITYDPKYNRVYIGTASAMRAGEPGDKLFSSSIVALEADTGRYVWHYQVNPSTFLKVETNYDATAQMILADLSVGGKTRPVLMQAPKNGFFYVIDRATGKLISAQKIGKATWADRIDLESGRPVKDRQIHYKKGDSVTVWPSAFGVHNWQKMSFHPGTGLAYIPTMKLGMRIESNGIDYSGLERDDGTGGLLAWDPVAQKKRWEVRYADCFWNGGTLATAGNLVLQGTGRGHFLAYDARTGEKLWGFEAGLGINAAPMTYLVDGVQYISVLVGYGGTANVSELADYGWRFNEQPRRLLTFALGKHTALPPSQLPRSRVKALDDPAFAIDTQSAGKGARVYHSNCVGCHGMNLESHASFAPDLRESALSMHWEAFKAVVQGGTLVPLGMPRFDDLSEDEMRAIYMYIRHGAREAARSTR